MYSFSFLDVDSEESFVRLVLEEYNLGMFTLDHHYIDHVYPDHYEDNYRRVKYDVHYSSLNENGHNFFRKLDEVEKMQDLDKHVKPLQLIYGYDFMNKQFLSWNLFKI